MAINTFVDAAEFNDDVTIAELDLSGEYYKQAGMFGQYSFKFFEAQRQTSNKEILLDVLRGKLDKEIRDRFATELGSDGKPRKFTEAVVTAEMNGMRAYIEAVRDYNDAKATEGLIKNLLEAFKQRKDMLVTLGANSRQEMEGELRMSVRQDGASSSVIPSREEILAATRRRMTKENTNEG